MRHKDYENAKYDQNQATPTITFSKLQAPFHRADTISSLAGQPMYLSNQYNDKNQSQNDMMEKSAFQILSGTLASIAPKLSLPNQHCYAYHLHHDYHELYDG